MISIKNVFDFLFVTHDIPQGKELDETYQSHFLGHILLTLLIPSWAMAINWYYPHFQGPLLPKLLYGALNLVLAFMIPKLHLGFNTRIWIFFGNLGLFLIYLLFDMDRYNGHNIFIIQWGLFYFLSTSCLFDHQKPFQWISLFCLLVIIYRRYQSSSSWPESHFDVLILVLCLLYGVITFYHYLRRSMNQLLRNLNKDLVLEEQLIEEHKLNFLYHSKMRMLSDLAGAMSHEINNPLSVIQGLSNVLVHKAQTTGLLELDSFQTNIDKMIFKIDQILAVVDELQKLSMNNDHYLKINLKELLQECTLEVSSKFDPSEVRILIDDSCQNYDLFIHEPTFKQAIDHILMNGFEAVLKCDVSQRWISFKTQMDQDCLELLVVNSGPPIPVDQREKVFYPFYTTKSVGSGRGLGLYTAKVILNQHHCQIRSSEYDACTCFVLNFDPQTFSSLDGPLT